MCTVLLPPGDNPIAVNKYIVSYQYVPHAPPLTFFLIWSPEYYLVRNTDYETHNNPIAGYFFGTNIKLTQLQLTNTSYRINICHMPRPSRFSWFDHPNIIWWGTQITKLIIMQSPLVPYYVVPLRPKYFPQRPILKGLRLGFSIIAWGLVSPHNKTTSKIIRLYILILIVLNTKLEDK